MIKAVALFLLRDNSTYVPASSFQQLFRDKAIVQGADWIDFVGQEEVIRGANILICTFEPSESKVFKDSTLNKVAYSIRIVNAV